MNEWWTYENLESGAPYDWSPATRGDHPDDQIDFHIDLGCGTVPKARLGIDRFDHENVDIQMNLDSLNLLKFGGFKKPRNIGSSVINYEIYFKPEDEKWVFHRLPFSDESIESIISHHCLEHIGDGFIRLMDECYRVLKPGGKFRIIVPLFPSFNAVSDPDHKRYFTEDTLQSFVHEASPDKPFWTESFSVPYTSCRFSNLNQEITPAEIFPSRLYNQSDGSETVNDFTIDDMFRQPREMRATLTK